MASPRYFGTDGLRGVANQGMLRPEQMLALGRALGRLAALRGGRVALARDPRRSSPMIAAALSAGIASEGQDVLDLGVLPTPGLAALLKRVQAGLGVMVSASHNPMLDNGVKVLESDGSKLRDEDEAWLEQQMERAPDHLPVGPAVGCIEHAADGVELYLEHLWSAFDGLDLGGLTVVVDGANGATARAAPLALTRRGAAVISLFTQPDGSNINQGCGSVHPDAMARAVVEHRAEIGLAFDGDGDRLILASDDGVIRDGDTVLYVCARHLKEQGLLTGDTVVGTVMSNFGLEEALRGIGVRLLRTPVGDRHVASALRLHGYALGGEPSGHVIFGARNGFIGDGLYSALFTLDVLRRSGKRLRELASALRPVPQELINVPVASKPPLEELPRLARSIESAAAELHGRGRILVRYSGTENLLRVMVEGVDGDRVRRLAEEVAGTARAEIGPGP